MRNGDSEGVVSAGDLIQKIHARLTEGMTDADEARRRALDYSIMGVFRFHVKCENWLYLSKWNPPIDLSSWLPQMFPKQDLRGCYLIASTFRKRENPGRFVAEIQSNRERCLDEMHNDEAFDPAYEFMARRLNSFGEIGFDLINQKPNVWRDSFYESEEWRTLRYQVIEFYGSRCMACGKTPKHGVMIHVDHIKPKSRFPELALEFNNLQILCDDCNLGKKNLYITDWRY